jgi:hypothetical protein
VLQDTLERRAVLKGCSLWTSSQAREGVGDPLIQMNRLL